MSAILSIKGLTKKYPSFSLEDVSFDVEKGSIMGFIGRNGAGKTTTLKSILNLVHPDCGEINFFGQNFAESEKEIKGRVGYAAGGISYYPRKRMRDIIKTTKSFYTTWDDSLYRSYLERFSLDENKRPFELSEGMKVKFNLTIALSHHAELLILDEPTSGLDPVSRDDLLEVFLDIAREGTAILFSTHIITDLDKCADSITYIKKGRIIASEKTDDFKDSFRMIGSAENLPPEKKSLALGICRSKDGDTALIRSSDEGAFDGYEISRPELEAIMVHLEK